MGKTLVFLVESNADLSNYVRTLNEAMELIEGDIDFMKDELEELQYTIDPVWMTDEEWALLPTE